MANDVSTLEVGAQIAAVLGLTEEAAQRLVAEAQRLYTDRMRERFSELKINDRLKRTNPFLLKIRGIKTVREWATIQVQSALFASEEEAVGHLLEAIAKIAHPKAQVPAHPDDFDFDVAEGDEVKSFQVKMSWDCMPMSSRKNLSNTIRKVRDLYEADGKKFEGIFAPCYGKASTTRPKGQSYTAMRSRDFWTQVGNGDDEYDVKVGDACALLCTVFRETLATSIVPTLITSLTEAAKVLIGDEDGVIDFVKLFRRINP